MRTITCLINFLSIVGNVNVGSVSRKTSNKKPSLYLGISDLQRNDFGAQK